MTFKFLSGHHINNLYEARHKAKELKELLEDFPCWIFEKDTKELFNSLEKVKTILNSAEEVRK
tara:strand:- start:237 stop:425 length:189 start_codon:yes stop_codon:yes gene_type:complete